MTQHPELGKGALSEFFCQICCVIYDAVLVGLLGGRIDAVGTTAYAYTAGGQLSTEDGPFASDTVTNLYSSRFRTNLVPMQHLTGFHSADAAPLVGQPNQKASAMAVVRSRRVQ